MSLIEYERAGEVGVVTLNRPNRSNSLVPEMTRQMLTILDGIGVDQTVRAVVLQAEGRAFSTGGDTQDYMERDDEIVDYARAIVGGLHRCMLAMIDLPIPIVAAVNGIVTGGGLGLLLASDYVCASRNVRIAPYYSVVGFSPEGGWTAILPFIIEPKRASEWLMLNRFVSAETLLDWGVVNRLCAAKRIREDAMQIAQSIAARQPGSIRHTKRLLWQERDQIAARLDLELEHFLQQITTKEARDGWRAFTAKRRV